jgi:hypothetical protein
MGKDKYKSVFYKVYLEKAKNCEEEDIINTLIYYKRGTPHIEYWIQIFEECKEMIESHILCAQSKKVYAQKCNKLTHEMGILINAQQMLYRFKSTVHQNCGNTFVD